MKKVIALILVIGILGGVFYYVRRVDQQDKLRMRELYSAVEPLQKEREALVSERDSLTAEYALQMRDVGTVELLFLELDERVYTEIYPKMRNQGIVGVLGINKHQFPGLADNLTVDQYNRLLKDGWGSCFVFENGLSTVGFKSWYKLLCDWMGNKGLSIPTAIYFPENTYDSSLDDTLIECGIQTVIVNAGDGHSATVTSLDEDIWLTGAMPWNYTGVSSDTSLLARTDGANLTFTVSFTNLWDAYEEKAFDKVIDDLVSLLASDDILQSAAEPTQTPQGQSMTAKAEDQLLKPLLRVVTFEQALKQHKDAEANNASLSVEQMNRESALNKQIEELDAKISALYEQWGNYGIKDAVKGA